MNLIRKFLTFVEGHPRTLIISPTILNVKECAKKKPSLLEVARDVNVSLLKKGSIIFQPAAATILSVKISPVVP